MNILLNESYKAAETELQYVIELWSTDVPKARDALKHFSPWLSNINSISDCWARLFLTLNQDKQKELNSILSKRNFKKIILFKQETNNRDWSPQEGLEELKKLRSKFVKLQKNCSEVLDILTAADQSFPQLKYRGC